MSGTLISDEYKKLNVDFHAKEKARGKPWGVSGRKYYGPAIDFAKELGAKSILDYGCGSSTLKQSFAQKGTLKHFDFREYDPCVPGKDGKRPDKADLVVNTDVMEHIEPEFIDNVFLELYNRSLKGTLIVIATVGSKEWLTPEINAHRTVQPAEWWIKRVEALNLPIHNVLIHKKKVYIWLKRPSA